MCYLESVIVKNFSFSTSHGKKNVVGWNVPWSKLLVSTGLDYVMVKIVFFSMAGIRHCQKCQFQHVWNVSWSKSQVSA
jgi:hypothetical protein